MALTQKGVNREDAYRIVQKHAMDVWKSGGNFLTNMKSDKEVEKYLTGEELESIFDSEQHLRNVDNIFKKVFKR